MSPLDPRPLGRHLPFALICALALAPCAWAAPRESPTAPGTSVTAAEPGPETADSPRAAVRAFLDLTARRGDDQAAARYLSLAPAEQPRAAELARRLRAVLERHHDVDLDTLSPAPEGNPDDGLPPGVDRLGRVPDGRGGKDAVTLVRTRQGQEGRWSFSRQTVSRIDGWYDALPDRWVRDWMPRPLQLHGPLELMWWQWIALPALVLLALLLGRLAGLASARGLARLALRTSTDWDDRLLRRIAPGLTLLWATAIAALLLPWLALLPSANAALRSALGGAATFALVWCVWRSLDVAAQFLMERPWAAENPSARSLLSVGRNLTKVLVAVGGAVAILAALGYPVTTVLAGLGIGGIALAFGAQKTIENLFGSVSLAADQPFRVGDFVRVEDFTGNVERIGMRSTQIRTLDRTLITLPNGKLADLRIEDFASRDRYRFATTVGLVYGTRAEQVEEVVTGIERLLRGEPKLWPDVVVAKLAALGPSSLDIEVLCWHCSADLDEFREFRQRALLGILRVVEEAGTSIAFPTRTVHVVPPEAEPGPEVRGGSVPSPR